MALEQLKELLPDFAKDIKLNFSNVLTEETGDRLTQIQLMGIALATAYSTKQPEVIMHFEQEAETILSSEQIFAAKSAATLMAMNNIYYRFSYLVDDHEISVMPAKLRMMAMTNHGIDKIDFELYSLAVSIINGCGKCVVAHREQLELHGLPKSAIHHVARIAAVVNAAAASLEI